MSLRIFEGVFWIREGEKLKCEGVLILSEDVLTDSYNSLPILSSPSRLFMYLL